MIEHHRHCHCQYLELESHDHALDVQTNGARSKIEMLLAFGTVTGIECLYMVSLDQAFGGFSSFRLTLQVNEGFVWVINGQVFI